MSFVNIAGYRFVNLSELSELREKLLERCLALQFKGTILLSHEGININLAGTPNNIKIFQTYLTAIPQFNAFTFRESFSNQQPFQRLRIRIKKEIITMGVPEIRPVEKRAPAISPQEFKHWLDENRDIAVLDTRNDYEIRLGTFAKAEHLNIADFRTFPEAVRKWREADREKPVVTFCTGGIRCEKAALELLAQGFKTVYQLDGGILNYFANCGGSHFHGRCFVFDGRVAVDANLEEAGTRSCSLCSNAAAVSEEFCSGCGAAF